jgi:hypothetical protein
MPILLFFIEIGINSFFVLHTFSVVSPQIVNDIHDKHYVNLARSSEILCTFFNYTKEIRQVVSELHVTRQKGNLKTGNFPNTSLIRHSTWI